MKSLFNFLSYNNAVPIAFSIMLLGGGAVFAASEPQTIYSTSSYIVSIDNTYLANKDLSSYSPSAVITSVTEDAEYYYVAYDFSTIDLVDGVWRDTVKKEVMNVSKIDLGADRDLGLYVTEQLKQKTDRELAYLLEVQNIEKQNITQKMVATEYGGLIGQMLNTNTETLPGYTPVIMPPPETEPVTEVPVPENPTVTPPVQSPGDPSLKVQILGENPARIPMGSQYSDLGAVTSDAENSTRLEVYQDGKRVEHVTIDTSAEGTFIIRYVALDADDNSVSAERTVIVFDPTPIAEEPVVSEEETEPAPETTEPETEPTE